jgi:hypothetical protein
VLEFSLLVTPLLLALTVFSKWLPLEQSDSFTIWSFIRDLIDSDANLEGWRAEKRIEATSVSSVGLLLPFYASLIWISLWIHLSFKM